jgi:hypothetical protein
MANLISEREYWVNTLLKISKPVLEALAEKRLKASMPVGSLTHERDDRKEYTCLEALGRTLDGLAPWLENCDVPPAETDRREECCILAREAIDAATNPESPDFVNFDRGLQPIVDAAFLAHAIIRSPNQLWSKLDQRVQQNLLFALKATRTRKPCFCNWLLFAAMIETALYKIGQDWDPMRIDYALKQHEQWYLGDGVYGDGPEFHFDYYNSFVIQPMLVDIIMTVGLKYQEWQTMQAPILKRAARYAEILERLIAPDGTFPAIGRSLAYRFGVFQHLAQMALQKNLPPSLEPAQVRSALTVVIKRMINLPGTFDKDGWLKIGFCGSQPEMGEPYISTGSLYLCTTVFLPLGLPADDEFWQGPECEWTSKKIWSGRNMPCDQALINENL